MVERHDLGNPNRKTVKGHEVPPANGAVDKNAGVKQEAQQQFNPNTSNPAADARTLNPAPNQTFKVGNGDTSQSIGGKISKSPDGAFRLEAENGNIYQAKAGRDGKMQSLQQIDTAGKPVGEPMKVTAERNGLPTAAEIKHNAEINKPSDSTKFNSHEAKGNPEQQKVSANHTEKPEVKQQGSQADNSHQPEKTNPRDGAERGGAPRDGAEQKKSQSDKSMMASGPQAEPGKSQSRPENIQAAQPSSSGKMADAADDRKRFAEQAHASHQREIAEAQKANDTNTKLSPTFEQNRKTAEMVLAKSSLDSPIPPRPFHGLESSQNDLKDTDFKRMFEMGEKSVTADGANGRHADVIDKMDNATSKADAAKFMDDKIALLATGIVNDRATRGAGADSKSGGGGGGSTKSAEEGNKGIGAKQAEGKAGSGDRGVGSGRSSDGVRDTARGGKDILPTEPTGKLKAQIENVDKLPEQKSRLAEMINKYSEGKLTQGEKESPLIVAFQSMRFDQLKGIGAWLEDKTRNPFEFKMLDGQSQKAVSKIFELVLGATPDRSGNRIGERSDNRAAGIEDARTVKIRDDQTGITKLPGKLSGKSGNGEGKAENGGAHSHGDRTAKLNGDQTKIVDHKEGRDGAPPQQDRTVKLDGTGKSIGGTSRNLADQLTNKISKSDNVNNTISQTRAELAGANKSDSTRRVDDTSKTDSTVKVDASKSSALQNTERTVGLGAEARGAASVGGDGKMSARPDMGPSEAGLTNRKIDADRVSKSLGIERTNGEELRLQNTQLNDTMKRLISTFRDQNQSATITSRVADSSTTLKALKRDKKTDAIPENEILDDESVKGELEEVMAQTPHVIVPSELSTEVDGDSDDAQAAKLEEKIKLERKSTKQKTKGFTKTGTHRVLKGDTFASIAKKYFDNESFAEIIFHYNKPLAEVSPIAGMSGTALALPKLGAFLKIPNKSAVWQFKLASYDYSSFRFDIPGYENASEELADRFGADWNSRIELLNPNTRILDENSHLESTQDRSISLQLNYNGNWLTIYEYKILETETYILKYSADATFTKQKKSLPIKQSIEMALNHFRNNFNNLTVDFRHRTHTN